MARGKKKEKALTPEEKLVQALVPEGEKPYQVPANWEWIVLGNLIDIRRGASPRPIKAYVTEDETGVNWIKIGDTDSGKYITHIAEKITSDGAKKSVFVEEGTLLLSNSMSFGRPYILKVNGCIHDGWLAITPSAAFNKEYLYYALLASEWYFEQVAVGTAVRNLNSERVAGTPVPCPPLVEQQRIVDRIESLFAKLDEAKEKAQSVLDSFETRKAAIRHKAFTGELTAKWRAEQGVHFIPNSYALIEVFNFIDYRGMTPDKTDSGIPLITAKNIKKGYIDYRISEYISQETYLQRLGRGIAHRNDLLITTEAPLGNVALADQDTYSTAQRVIVLQLREEYRDKVNNRYVMHYMLDESFQHKLQDQKTGATVAGIKAAKLKLIPIVLPDVDEQAEVVRILNSLFAKEQQAKEAAEAVLEKIDLLKKSILARAFRGELGTNDPNEESAVELLKQILEADAHETPKKRRKSIPKELKEELETELERKIIHLYFQRETESLPAEVLLSVSSKKFDVLKSLHNLEQRELIKKLNNGNYRLLR